MHWRYLKLNWSYGLGELFIVIAGVLIALAVDQWNSDLQDRQEEKEILEQLAADLKYDIDDLAFQLQELDKKEASLLRVHAVFATGSQSVAEPLEFLSDIVNGANFGWNQFEARGITFNELLSTGRFALIRNSGLREMIAGYYTQTGGVHQRIDERETAYPGISYQLVDRLDEGSETGDIGGITPGVSDEEAPAVVSNILNSSIGPHVQAELNFARFVRAMSLRLETSAKELKDELETYRSSLD